jgi:hypothetical protein
MRQEQLDFSDQLSAIGYEQRAMGFERQTVIVRRACFSGWMVKRN